MTVFLDLLQQWVRLPINRAWQEAAMPELTPWFPSSIKPFRWGQYEVRWGGISLMRLWRGRWFVMGHETFQASCQDVEWRGLASDPAGVRVLDAQAESTQTPMGEPKVSDIFPRTSE